MSILAQVDLTLALAPEAYAEQLPAKQAAVSLLMRQVMAQKRPVVIIFEGSDPAGQGDAIKRLTEKLDPRFYVVYRNAPAEGEDKVRPYLYRFWRRLPGRGYAVIFDGSWYERVLAERVDGRTHSGRMEPRLPRVGPVRTPIDRFRRDRRQVLAARGRKRAGTAGERLGYPGVVREPKTPRYEEAAEEMLLKTSTLGAPWTIVEANDAAWAEIRVLDMTAETLVRELAPVAEPSGDGPDAGSRKKAKKVKA